MNEQTTPQTKETKKETKMEAKTHRRGARAAVETMNEAKTTKKSTDCQVCGQSVLDTYGFPMFGYVRGDGWICKECSSKQWRQFGNTVLDAGLDEIEKAAH